MDKTLRSLPLTVAVFLPSALTAQTAPPDGFKKTSVPEIVCQSVENLGMIDEGMTDPQLASIDCRKLPPGTVIFVSWDHRKIVGGMAVRARNDFPDRIDLFWIREGRLVSVPSTCKPPHLELC
mgnify:CR=1 FL=1|jgi:hypothetical protein